MTYAANADDDWVLARFPDDFVGYAVEVGAFDGFTGSNTLLLERRGWTTLAVEPNPDLEGGLRLWRKLYRLCACGAQNLAAAPFHIYNASPSGHSSLAPILDHPTERIEVNDWKIVTVPVRTLDSLLEEAQFPRLDFLSIDTEGTELDVLKGINLEKWTPKIIMSECWDEGGPAIEYLYDRGYDHIHRSLVNDIYLRRE